MTTYRVEGADCAGCARELGEGISRLPGVQSACVDFVTAKLYVEGDESFTSLQARAKAFGKTLFADTEAKINPTEQQTLPVTGGDL